MSIPNFTHLNELASERNGGKILFSTDDWFATAENLLKEEDVEWKENLFTSNGKWMDGWETRRKRIAGHDWTIIALGRSSVIKGICVDTAFFTGNHAPRFSIQAARLTPQEENAFPKRFSQLGSAASDKDLKTMTDLKTEEWTTLIPMTKLQPGYPETRKHYVEIMSEEKWTHLRLNIFPDGGIARLRVYGFAKPEWHAVNSNTLIDLLSIENGGVCMGFSDAHYGHPKNLIKPGRGINMGDGWETARKHDRPPIIKLDSNGIIKSYGDEWALFKLGHVGKISSIHVDTIHFKGNYPQNIKVEGALVSSDENIKDVKWKLLLTPQKLFPDQEHNFELNDRIENDPINYVKISIAPDGGISRVRICGFIQPNWNAVNNNNLIDLVSIENRDVCRGIMNAHYGVSKNLIKPSRELIKGNHAENIQVERVIVSCEKNVQDVNWKFLLPLQKLFPDKEHNFELNDRNENGSINYVIVSIAPDGSISRV